MEQYYLILDIGGTKTSGALFTQAGQIVEDYVYLAQSKTFSGEEAVYQNTKAVLLHVLEHFHLGLESILGIGVGSPGPLDTKTGVIVHAPLMRWHNFPIVARLTEDFSKPVVLDNDANLGALAEQRCGVVAGLQNILYMTVSTGCGGGILINGQIYRGAHDGAGEFGHMSIDPEGLPCPCGSKGCFELYASGTALQNTMQQDMAAGKKSLAFELCDDHAQMLNGGHLSQAAAQGDAYALALYEKEGYYLGVGIANLFNLYDPEAIVLGGGVTKARAYFYPSLLKTLQARSINPVSEDSVRFSVMNDRVVLYGAFYLIKEHVEKNKQ